MSVQLDEGGDEPDGFYDCRESGFVDISAEFVAEGGEDGGESYWEDCLAGLQLHQLQAGTGVQRLESGLPLQLATYSKG